MRESLALQEAISTPAVGTHAGSLVSKDVLRILVSRTSVSVDNAALWASWPPARRARVLALLAPEDAATMPFVRRDLLAIEGDHIAPRDAPDPGRLELRALDTVLSFARHVDSIEREVESKQSPPSAPRDESIPVAIYAASDTSYRVLISVVATARRAGFSPLLVARSPLGNVALGLDATRGADGGKWTSQIWLTGEGVFVTAEDSWPRFEPNPTPRRSPFLGPVVSAERACPLGWDPSRISSLAVGLLERMPECREDRMRVCREVRIVADFSQKWGAIASMTDALANAGVHGFSLGLISETTELPDCKRSIPVDRVIEADFSKDSWRTRNPGAP